MWLFKQNISLVNSKIFQGFTDWHCHLLPGVDDGVQTMEESLQILAQYEALGIRKVWFTPHIMEDIPNTTAGLKVMFEGLNRAYSGSIDLYLSAEYMLDFLFEERLKSNDLLPLGSEGNHLLVETSYFRPPMDLFATLERIMVRGYYPVLAHPERYVYMEKEDYQKLWDAGVKFQLNLFSLVGLYGEAIKNKAKYLLQKKMFHLCGTDTHSRTSFLNSISMKTKEIPCLPLDFD